MKYEDAVDNLTIIAIAINFLEKIVSYIEQKNFPNTIFEGNIYTAPIIQQYGLAWGHIIPFILSLATIILLRYMAIYIPPKLESYPIHKEIAMGIIILALTLLIAIAVYSACNNIYLIWINL